MYICTGLQVYRSFLDRCKKINESSALIFFLLKGKILD
uniref:Uncharacterized protein n=1 Tax=Triticum urartu TaxID=4572 RepID=A0A8R7PF07_TRIUA